MIEFPTKEDKYKYKLLPKLDKNDSLDYNRHGLIALCHFNDDDLKLNKPLYSWTYHIENVIKPMKISNGTP